MAKVKPYLEFRVIKQKEMNMMEKEYFTNLCEECYGDVKLMCEVSGIKPKNLFEYFKRLNIKREKYENKNNTWR